MAAALFRAIANFTDRICCPTCGQLGVEVWESNSAAHPLGRLSQFVRRSDESYGRISKKKQPPLEIVCRGSVMPDKLR